MAPKTPWRLALLLLLATLNAGATAQPPPAAHSQTPSPRQLAWHQHEYYAFVHFGPNTFTDEEWGLSQQPPSVFAPTDLSTDQWAATFAAAGMSGMILTAKHHDGMCLWPTNTTAYTIANSPWARNRTTKTADVVRMAAASARKHGLRFGVYLSPWDMHRDPAIPKPLLAGTIFDEPQIFGDDSSTADDGSDYNDLYAAQLAELVGMTYDADDDDDGQPIPLFEVWLDGASGSDTVQTFDWARFRDVIRESQPDAVMWGHQGVDARWVGNEDGETGQTNWHTISRTQDDERYSGEELEEGVRNGAYWTPAEADARVRQGWFWHKGEEPKGAGELVEMWGRSVGRSVALLLDVPPDGRGRIAEGDVEVLMEFRARREAFLRRDVLGPGVVVNASGVRGGNDVVFGPAKVLDGDAETYWTMDDGETTGAVEFELDGAYSVDAFVTQEHIALGQRIGGYEIGAVVNGTWTTVVTGTSLGYKRIDRLSEAVRTSRVRFSVTQADAVPLISAFQVLGTRESTA
ncbi:glycoside hydrolase [Diplodia corticola]|uniref:alpha-L-fucosidase n=1 Tax=Diplodia corticola TaxID=236234 RepID=A0A1J9RM99_9PEZI|nr:glycoside hydrolase [Diplodia corticola]OJD29639.1 glycoside hydrolase [Diplodia corticola]